MARARFCRESTRLDNARYGWSCAARQHRSVQGFCVLGGPGSPGSQRDNRSQNRSKTSPRSPRMPSSGLTATRILAIDINRPSLQGEPGGQPVIYRHGMDATPCNANTVWWIMPTTTARSVGGPRIAGTTVTVCAGISRDRQEKQVATGMEGRLPTPSFGEHRRTTTGISAP